MIEILCETPLTCGTPVCYRGLAYDGCRFSLLRSCEPVVDFYDKDLKHVGCSQCCRVYTCLCYDPAERCYWAAADSCPATVFQLDAAFCELRALEVHHPRCGANIVTGLSVCCCKNALFVAFSAGIATLDKCGHSTWNAKEPPCLQGILSLCPSTLCWYGAEGGPLLRLYDSCGALCEECKLPCGLCIDAAVLAPYQSPQEQCPICMLVSRQGHNPSLLLVALDNCPPLCPCNALLPRPCASLPEDHCCPPPCEERPCLPPCPPLPHRPDPCADVLESIALMEAALSHILNAEGEKLQKVIATCSDPRVLLATNQSVNEALESATALEKVLLQKLQALKSLCCSGEKHSWECNCH